MAHPSTPPPKENKEALLLTVAEVCRKLHRSKARVYELTATGELPSIKDGKSVLIPVGAPEAWLKRKLRQNGHFGTIQVDK